MAYEPRTMHHPHARKAKITPIEGVDPVSGKKFTDYQGEPDTFPDVTVKDPETEAYYRSRGYLFDGEVPAPPAEYAEYPVMLSHPDHVDAVPDDFIVEKTDGGEILKHRVPGKPEVLPARQANNPAEEKDLIAKGYRRAGADDAEAIRTAKASPYKAGRKKQEFPKMVAGKVVDPGAPIGGPVEYPKYVGDILVKTRGEEDALLAKAAAAAPAKPETPAPIAAQAKAAKARPEKPQPLPGPADGRQPLKTTARESRKAAREKNKPAAQGRAPRQQVPAGG